MEWSDALVDTNDVLQCVYSITANEWCGGKSTIFDVPDSTFIFCELQHAWNADFSDMFMVSYDVTSLFTSIPLSETIDLAVNAIFKSYSGLDLKLSKIQLKESSFSILLLATLIFYSTVAFMIK